jgi:hypothetical protein
MRAVLLAALLLVPAAGALPVARAEQLEGTAGYVVFELGRNLATCIPHPIFDPLPGQLEVVLVHALPADAWAVSFTFAHLAATDPLGDCVVHEDCALDRDPTLGRAQATCARDVLPQGYVQLQPEPDGSYAFTSFLGLPFPGGGADLVQGTVRVTRALDVP